MARIDIFDTTLRDGEQSPGATMTRSEKLRMAHQLDALGVDVIEAGFPVSSPDDYGAVRVIAREVRRPVIAALARATPTDIERAGAALAGAERSRIHVFIATSDIHLQRKLKISRAECLDRAAQAVELAHQFVDDVEFSAEDATRTNLEFLAEVVAAAVAAGATTINIPDTVGYAYPGDIHYVVSTLFHTVPQLEHVTVSVHCHDDLGLAVANSLAGLEAGATQVECTVNGIGERAGNAALEEIVMSLVVRNDRLPFETAIDTREISKTSRLLTQITGIHPQPNKAIVGLNAFAHEAGIHQDGMIKDQQTYEIMTPEMVGASGSHLVLGKHSGRHALARRYREMGYELDGASLDRAYDMFKSLADQKKRILDEDLLSILHHGVMDDVPSFISLANLEVVCGNGTAKARVLLADRGGTVREAGGQGDGPIAAAFAAVNAIAKRRIQLEDFQVHAATPGRDALGEVSLRARIDGKTFTGSAAATDVVRAAVLAYVHALNKSEQAEELEAKALEESSYLWGV